MTITQIYRVLRVLPVFAILSMTTVAGFAQRGGLPVEPLGDGPWEFATAEQGMRIEVSIVTRGLFHPWDMAFLPNGDILVTERRGQLRIVRDGVLDPDPIPGVPTVHAVRLSGLMDIELHPDFSENQFVYLTYTKNLNPDPLEVATTLARGRLVDNGLVGVEDILVADSWPGNGGSASRIAFGPDGYLYLSDRRGRRGIAQGRAGRLVSCSRPCSGLTPAAGT